MARLRLALQIPAPLHGRAADFVRQAVEREIEVEEAAAEILALAIEIRRTPVDRRLPAPPPTLAEVRADIRRLPLSDREQLAPLFSPAYLRAARLAERDAAILEMAAGRQGNASQLARQVHDRLARYRLGSWRFEHGQSAPFDPRNRLPHRVLALTGGRVPEVNSIRKLFKS